LNSLNPYSLSMMGIMLSPFNRCPPGEKAPIVSNTQASRH
jgi:hypothetical protein